MSMKTLNEILAAAIADIQAAKYDKKEELSSFICKEFLALPLEPAIKAVIPRVVKEWFAETGNIVKNGESFLPLIPELQRWQRGYYSERAEIKAKGVVAKSSGKSNKIDNSLFCEVLEKLFTLAPTKGGFKETDKASLEKLLPFLRGGVIKVDGEDIQLEVHTIEQVKQLIQDKVIDSTPEELKANEKERDMRFDAFKRVEQELERLANLAKTESEQKTKKVRKAI